MSYPVNFGRVGPFPVRPASPMQFVAAVQGTEFARRPKSRSGRLLRTPERIGDIRPRCEMEGAQMAVLYLGEHTRPEPQRAKETSRPLAPRRACRSAANWQS